MSEEDRLKDVVARSLSIPADQVSDALEFSVTPEWSSLAHVTLMLELESEYGVIIPDDLVLELSNYPAIRSFIVEQTASSGA